MIKLFVSVLSDKSACAMADVAMMDDFDTSQLPEDIREKLAELDLELSEGL